MEPGRAAQAIGEVLADEPEVRPLVVGRDQAVVAEPDVGRAPVRLELGRELVGRAGRRAARERKVAAATRGGCEELRR
jgi:hypothetical protein